MKILNIEWEAFGLEDIKDAFAAEGYDVSGFPFSKHENAVDNQEMEKRFRSVLCKEVPDVVFSFDYYPVFSKVCQQEHIRYISWVYDNPQILLYSDMVVNPCNVIFVFDKKIYQEFHDSGIKTVHYMPLAVNTERLDHMTLDAQSCKYDISFVGSLYLEELSYFERMSIRLSDYAKGYLDSLMAAQMRIQGYNFIEESLGVEIVKVLADTFAFDTSEELTAIVNEALSEDEELSKLFSVRVEVAGK